MPILERGETISPTNPKLTYFGITAGPADFQAGKLQDPFALSFEVVDISTTAKKNNPSVVVPKTAMNLVADKLGTGRFAPTFTLSATEPIGRHAVRFYYELNSGDPEQSDQCEFDVVEGMSAFTDKPFYAYPCDLKDEGVCGHSDAFLLERLALASRYVERFTGRFFDPRYLEVNVDGYGNSKLLLQDPIIAIQDVSYETSPFLPADQLIGADLLRIYSRHLSQGLFQPDDRNNPKIELYNYTDDSWGLRPAPYDRLIFPRGQQNIIVRGVFGYTDRASASCGGTPDLIRHACKLLAIRNLEKMSDLTKREDALKRYRLLEEKTRDQSYKLQPLGGAFNLSTSFTGDPEIDQILASYVRPPRLGAA